MIAAGRALQAPERTGSLNVVILAPRDEAVTFHSQFLSQVTSCAAVPASECLVLLTVLMFAPREDFSGAEAQLLWDPVDVPRFG
jgi:hypothetical protein